MARLEGRHKRDDHFGGRGTAGGGWSWPERGGDGEGDFGRTSASGSGRKRERGEVWSGSVEPNRFDPLGLTGGP